jgi:hypothetical protein
MTSSSKRALWINQERNAFVFSYAIPQRMIDKIGGHTVHVLPWEAGVLFAYPGLHWHPLPIFQDYSAYTKPLDDRNADALASSDRPDFVLRQPGLYLDDRVARFDPPRENLELLCRYHVVDRAPGVSPSPGWELLKAGPDRCGKIVQDATRVARLGEVVHTPARRGKIVLARFSGIGSSFEDQLETLLLRGPDFFIGSTAGDQPYEFIQSTQSSWHVLSAPACLTAELDGTGPLFPTFVLSDHHGPATGDATYGIQFAQVSYSCS